MFALAAFAVACLGGTIETARGQPSVTGDPWIESYNQLNRRLEDLNAAYESDGKCRAHELEKIMVRITLAGATFLAVIALIPQSLQIWLGMPPGLAAFLGGTSILITVSVALDLVDKLNSHLLMRNYEGFMKGGGRRRR